MVQPEEMSAREGIPQRPQHTQLFLSAQRNVAKGERRGIRWLFLIVGAGLLFVLKVLYATASLEQLRFLLAPVSIKARPLPNDNALEDVWLAGLSLRGKWIAHHFYPQYTSEDRLAIVKGSFATQVLTPMTAFLALENEAQKTALRKKQEDVLKAKHALDIGEETRMSEPGFLIMLAMVFMLAALRNRTRLTAWLKN